MEESIYNLIPKEYVPPQKQPLYKSKYNPAIPPTGSTFVHGTTSVPKTGNLNGDMMEPHITHTNKGDTATFGKPKGQNKKDQLNYTKKQTGTMGKSLSPLEGSDYRRETEFKKPEVPKIDEKPIMGLVSQKNYVVANQVENMLSQAKTREDPARYVNKEDYGKTPQYLEKIKENINREYDHIKNLRNMEEEEEARKKFLLNDEEVRVIREGLKKKWDVVNKEYQKITHKGKLDTIGLRRRKEDCERELAQLEKDIEKLNKTYICVATN
jgi:hypothetical protein